MPLTDVAWGGVVDTLVGAAARTVSGSTSPLFGYGPAKALRAQLDVTAVAGVGATLDVVIEDTLDGTNWNTIGTFAQRTAVGRQVIDITTPFSNQLRVRWALGGTTPSFTFSVVALAD